MDKLTDSNLTITYNLIPITKLKLLNELALDMNSRIKNKSWVTGLFAALAASLCCITPILALLGGASGLASSFSWVEPLRPYLIGLTILVFVFAWYQKLIPVNVQGCECEVPNKQSFWHSKAFLGIITIVSGALIVFPYYAKAFYPTSKAITIIVANKINIQEASFKIKGMTCVSCSEYVNSEISKVKGIISFVTSYEKASCTVKFDKSQTSINTIAAVISNTGYEVVSQTIMNK